MNVEIISAQRRSALLHSVRCIATLVGVAFLAAFSLGQTPQSGQPELSAKQQSVAERFSKLEAVLLRSSELEAVENPTRAALLRQAVQLSKQVQLAESLAAAAKNLGDQQYSDAIARQKAARQSLNQILELLQSENRSERVREQRQQVRQWIEETERLLRMQGALRGRTEGGQALELSQENQAQLEAKVKELADDLLGKDSDSENTDDSEKSTDADGPKLQQNEAGKPESANEKPPTEGPSSSESGEAKPDDEQPTNNPSSEEQPGQQQPDEQQAGEQQSGEQQSGEQQSGEQQSGEQQSGEQQSGEQQSGEQQSGEQQSGEQQAEQEKQMTPTERAGRRLREAQRAMKEAQEKLEQAQREGAVEKQREAEDQLRDAVDELEKILRQLREEEIERSLASLESRLRNMLEMQTKVLAETERLNDISGGEKTRQVEIMANKLSLQQRDVLRAGEKAYLLLREEGSSAAFPEAMEQVNRDVASVAERLATADVGTLTIVIEQEIVSSLEEMVAAIANVQKENRKKEQQAGQGGGGGQGGQQGDRPLVDKLAELRLVKTLQTRINKRTAAMSKLLSNPDDMTGQVSEMDILSQVRELAQREQRIHGVTIKLLESD